MGEKIRGLEQSFSIKSCCISQFQRLFLKSSIKGLLNFFPRKVAQCHLVRGKQITPHNKHEIVPE